MSNDTREALDPEAVAELVEALDEAATFIDQVRQDLLHERIADWYPEGAHNAAAHMSETMRLIGNRCADFDASATLAKHGQPQGGSNG